MTTDAPAEGGHHPTVAPAEATSPGAGEPDPTIVALGRAVQRALRRIDTLDKNVLQLAADVTALGAHLTPPPPGGPGDAGNGADEAAGDGPPEVRSWLLATDPDHGFSTMPRAHEVKMTTWVMQNVDESEKIQAEYSRRKRTIRSGQPGDRWCAFSLARPAN